eukprot:TRINITY_DN93926_c0_g1_i1.p1 TRINITY_DN93926_c0_g1~~TRINITY_DN93926_c0_g1_i1.p1  ORF type:complete len:226 (-),score=33.28 TRINITY_DN93926_c0_g1_i1:43-720(-)
MVNDRLPDGCKVRLKDLVSKPENNGREGTIVCFLEDALRYSVQMPSGATVKLRRENLENWTAPANITPAPPSKAERLPRSRSRRKKPRADTQAAESKPSKPAAETAAERHQRLFGGSKGVVVETLKSGDGKTFPKKGDKCVMHYTGTLASNGKKFDSSIGKAPFSFRIGVGQVIRGWDEGVIRMSLGEKAMLRITADYGYGSRGAGSAIPPDADLVFEVELLRIC